MVFNVDAFSTCLCVFQSLSEQTLLVCVQRCATVHNTEA